MSFFKNKPNNGLITIKDLLSISGSGFTVWIFCSVITTFLPSNLLVETETLVMRYVALLLSLLFSYVIYLNTNYKLIKDEEKKSVNVVILVLINGMFIYLNAVGCNSISTGTSFEKKEKRIHKSSLLPFLKDVSWWPDKKLIAENNSYKSANKKLVKQVDSLQNTRIDTMYVLAHDNLNNSFTLNNNDVIKYTIRKISPSKTDSFYLIKESTLTRIGTQVWMSNNLNVDHYQNGDLIFEAKTTQEWLKCDTNKIGCWCYYDNNPENGKIYGKLYNWHAVQDKRGLAPRGWHVATKSDFLTLIDYLGGQDSAGFKMKTIEYWKTGRINLFASNESKWNGVPGGDRSSSGIFSGMGLYGFWCCQNDLSPGGKMSVVSLGIPTTVTIGDNYCPSCAFSIRCISNKK